jgi:hypothetical protein
MRTTITYRALSAWPNNVPATPYHKRKRSPFRSTWGATLEDLDRELVAARAHNVVIEIDAPASEIRRDGMPRADARTRGPGVIISYELRWTRAGAVTRVERFVFPCDTFHDWQDNVRAIAKTLEALRAVDRYGVTRDGQQFAGFKSIPAETSATQSVAWAVGLLSRFGLISVHDGDPDFESCRRAYRSARAKTHPDAGGTAADFQAVNAAGERLAAHFGSPL